MRRPLQTLWVLLMLALALISPRAHAQNAPAQTLTDAWLSAGLCVQKGSAQPVRLPDDWRESGLKAPSEGCYRLALRLKASPAVPWALRMDRLPGNHRITVNGVTLSTRYMESRAITSMGTRPYLVEVPVGLLREGENHIDVDVRMGPYRKPGVSPLIAGPLVQLREPYEDWCSGATTCPAP